MPKFEVDDNNYVYFLVGKNIKKQRKLKKWTQKELAEKCNLSDGFIGDIESDTFRTISLNTLYMVAKVLGVNIKVLFDDLEDEKN